MSANISVGRRKELYDSEVFKILGSALRKQGVTKPLTDEFYESVLELHGYITKVYKLGRIEEVTVWRDMYAETVRRLTIEDPKAAYFTTKSAVRTMEEFNNRLATLKTNDEGKP